MRQGRRLDGVIRSIQDNSHEFGGMEVARTAVGGVKSTKRLTDTDKLLRALRDMLEVLSGLEFKQDPTPVLQVVGVICAGLQMQLIRMGCYRGSVAVVFREVIVEVPVVVAEFGALTKLLVTAACLKVCYSFHGCCPNG